METAKHFTSFVQLAGGLGVFLLGMIVMTEGLKAVAGDSMRNALIRFTRSPSSGALTGAACTALLQSSSATTVAAVGFVGAGLLNFPEALGIVFGANIGTTITGWLVALLGFKLKLGTAVLPLILLGAILRLFARHRLAAGGYALAGFGLIFVGIAGMQQAMSGYDGWLSPEKFPNGGLAARAILVATGMIFTIITQSSSAGVATVLTALYGGAVSFEQAASLVIGMDIGTSVTAAMASIGGSVGMRRTGISHVIYNLFTGIGALLLLSPYVLVWETFAPQQFASNPEIALVAFHTTFNTLGVLFILPFTKVFAALIERIVPEKVMAYTAGLDRSLLPQPDLALTAAQNSVYEELLALLRSVIVALTEGIERSGIDLEQLQIALDTTHDFVDRIHLDATDKRNWVRLIAINHTMDHLRRMHERCEEDEDRAIVARKSALLKSPCDLLRNTLQNVLRSIEDARWQRASEEAKATANQLNEDSARLRDAVIAEISRGVYDVPEGTDLLRAIRWLQRVGEHVARVTHHFCRLVNAAGS